MCGQQHSFSCESVKVFETENVSTWGGLEPPTFGFMPNALTYWAIGARHFLSYVFEHWLWLWWYRYFWSKVNVWNVNWARATAFIFDTRTSVPVKVSKFLRQKMSRPEGNSNPQPSYSCRMLEPIELSGPDICCPMFLKTGSGGIDIFEVKLTFEMLTVRGQQHSFSTHVFLWKCQSLWDRKRFDLRGTRTPNVRIHAECSNILSYQGQTFAVPCFWTLDPVV